MLAKNLMPDIPPPLNTFDDVAAHYARVKPIADRHDVKDTNIRPIGSRNRKFERIIRVDDNTYVLNDGFMSGLMAKEGGFKTAPILWERKVDGDYVTFRSCPAGSSWSARWNFISKYAPEGVYLHISPSKLGSIHLDVTGLGVIPLLRFGYMVNVLLTRVVLVDDQYVSLKVIPDGGFERVNKVRVLTNITNKARLKADKEIIDTLYEEMLVLAPFRLDKDSVLAEMNRFQRAGRALYQTYEGGGLFAARPVWIVFDNIAKGKVVNTDLAREIIANPDDEMRPMLISLLIECLGVDLVRSTDGLKELRTKYLAWCKRVLGIYEEVVI
jgi:hypothetical protein